ncbi:MAG: hypothetical protein DLM57_01915 [Pseudonocardiales bacterium]|nr:MAG: hypothetical protein DLM57_01915 [Pseudonocardiales bacterium]
MAVPAVVHKRTFLIRHGRVWTCRFSAAGWAAGAALVLTSLGGANSSIAATYTAGTCAAIALLAALARDRSPRRDETIISALAILGRGLLTCLLAQLAMRHDHWAPAAITAIIGLLALIVTAQTLSMLRHGPLSRLTIAATPVARHPLPACRLATKSNPAHVKLPISSGWVTASVGSHAGGRGPSRRP